MTGIKKFKRYLSILPLWSFLFLVQCGIEVGNPHSEDDDIEESRITIEITDAPVDDVNHVYLNIEKIYLVNPEGGLVELPMDISGPLDILSLQDGTTSVLVQDQSVSLSSIQGYFIALSEDEPGYVVTNTGASKSLYLPDERHHIFIEESSNLNDSNSVVLHFDLRHSLNLDDNGNYYIDPVIYSVKRSESSLISGQLTDLSRGFVCLYREDDLNLTPATADQFTLTKPRNDISSESEKAKNERLVRLSGNEDAGRRPPPPGPGPTDGQKPPPSLGDDRFIPKGDRPPHRSSGLPPDGGRPPRPEDSSRICGDAYVGVPLKSDGRFSFHFLKSGQYSIRVFEGPGTYYDLKDTIRLDPGSSKDLGAFSIKN